MSDPRRKRSSELPCVSTSSDPPKLEIGQSYAVVTRDTEDERLKILRVEVVTRSTSGMGLCKQLHAQAENVTRAKRTADALIDGTDYFEKPVIDGYDVRVFPMHDVGQNVHFIIHEDSLGAAFLFAFLSLRLGLPLDSKTIVSASLTELFELGPVGDVDTKSEIMRYNFSPLIVHNTSARNSAGTKVQTVMSLVDCVKVILPTLKSREYPWSPKGIEHPLFKRPLLCQEIVTKSEEGKLHIIRGMSGVGKSSLVKYELLDLLQQHKWSNRIPHTKTTIVDLDEARGAEAAFLIEKLTEVVSNCTNTTASVFIVDHFERLTTHTQVLSSTVISGIQTLLKRNFLVFLITREVDLHKAFNCSSATSKNKDNSETSNTMVNSRTYDPRAIDFSSSTAEEDPLFDVNTIKLFQIEPMSEVEYKVAITRPFGYADLHLTQGFQETMAHHMHLASTPTFAAVLLQHIWDTGRYNSLQKVSEEHLAQALRSKTGSPFDLLASTAEKAFTTSLPQTPKDAFLTVEILLQYLVVFSNDTLAHSHEFERCFRPLTELQERFQLSPHQLREALIPFVKKGLLCWKVDDGEPVAIQITHDLFFEHWQRLADFIKRSKLIVEKEKLLFLAKLERLACDFNQRGKGRFLSRDELKRASHLANTHVLWPTNVEKIYIVASKKNTLKMLARGIFLSVLALFVLALAGNAYWQYSITAESLYKSSVALAFSKDKEDVVSCANSVILALAAYASRPSESGVHRAVTRVATSTAPLLPIRVTDVLEAGSTLAISPDGSWIVSAERKLGVVLYTLYAYRNNQYKQQRVMSMQGDDRGSPMVVTDEGTVFWVNNGLVLFRWGTDTIDPEPLFEGVQIIEISDHLGGILLHLFRLSPLAPDKYLLIDNWGTVISEQHIEQLDGSFTWTGGCSGGRKIGYDFSKFQMHPTLDGFSLHPTLDSEIGVDRYYDLKTAMERPNPFIETDTLDIKGPGVIQNSQAEAYNRIFFKGPSNTWIRTMGDVNNTSRCDDNRLPMSPHHSSAIAKSGFVGWFGRPEPRFGSGIERASGLLAYRLETALERVGTTFFDERISYKSRHNSKDQAFEVQVEPSVCDATPRTLGEIPARFHHTTRALDRNGPKPGDVVPFGIGSADCNGPTIKLKNPEQVVLSELNELSQQRKECVKSFVYLTFFSYELIRG